MAQTFTRHETASHPAVMWLLATSFSGTLFLSALLVFSVQPMFAKLALPLLGGSPSVWSTAMVFFQAVLLAGYAYAHLLITGVRPRLQGYVHALALAIGALSLPFALDAATLPAPGAPLYELHLIGAFALAIGLPFFAISANAPIMQAWFARSGHPRAADPYFLYATSNLGSVAALLAYPFLIEPFADLRLQTWGWAALYAALILAIAISVLQVRPQESASDAETGSLEQRSPAVPWSRRLRWLGASMVPASLLLGTTAYISTNIAAMPLLWVVPLALYLLTFVIVFDHKRPLPMGLIGFAFVVLLALVLLLDPLLKSNVMAMLGVHLALFFLATLICHADLAGSRPPADRLTGFYLIMSAGGVIGGALTALVAPYVFPTLLEYPLMLIAAALFLPAATGSAMRGLGYGVVLGGLLAIITAAGLYLDNAGPYILLLLLAAGGGLLLARWRPVHSFGAGLACLLAAQIMLPMLGLDAFGDTVETRRNFFGVSRVTAAETDLGTVHRYLHGDTTHNLQLQSPGLAGVPLAYYALEGPFGDVLRVTRETTSRPRVGVIGLGAGAMACHAEPGEDWRFYEIDPAVIHIATDPTLFSYVSDCAPDAPIVLGDARMTLAAEPGRGFDLLIVDAFSSDAIPAHLLTIEALKLYRQKLAWDGLVFFHVSNRFADIASVVTATANAAGLTSRYILYTPDPDAPLGPLKNKVAAIAVGPTAVLDQLDGWEKRQPHAFIRPWTDDYSNIAAAIAAHVLPNW